MLIEHDLDGMTKLAFENLDGSNFAVWSLTTDAIVWTHVWHEVRNVR
jgi:hypothetical protein